MNIDEKNENNSKSTENSKINRPEDLSSPNNVKKEKKKRNRKKKKEKITKSKNLFPENDNFSDGILSEIKQITIPTILSEKENLFKILQSEIINIDKSLSLLN